MSELTLIINTPKTQQKGIEIKISEEKTIGDAKNIYFRIVGNRDNNQWMYDAQILKDNMTISSYGIEDRDIIEAHPTYKGGIR